MLAYRVLTSCNQHIALGNTVLHVLGYSYAACYVINIVHGYIADLIHYRPIYFFSNVSSI